MGSCFSPECDHTHKHGCKMFHFPKNPKLREKWENLVRRGDRKSNKFSVLCSCHFENGDKSKLPNIFKRNIGKRFNFPSLPEKKRRSNLPRKEVVSVVFENLTSTSKDVGNGRGSNVDVQVPSTSKPSLEEDMLNYARFKLMKNINMKIKPGIVPHIFDCETGAYSKSCQEVLRQRETLLDESLSELKKTRISNGDTDTDIEGAEQEPTYGSNEVTQNTSDKAVQVNIKPRICSKSSQCDILKTPSERNQIQTETKNEDMYSCR